jgi:hypothetical protein
MTALNSLLLMMKYSRHYLHCRRHRLRHPEFLLGNTLTDKFDVMLAEQQDNYPNNLQNSHCCTDKYKLDMAHHNQLRFCHRNMILVNMLNSENRTILKIKLKNLGLGKIIRNERFGERRF